MDEKPKLALGDPPKALKIKTSGGIRALLWVVLLLQVGVAALLVLRGRPLVETTAAPGGTTGPDTIKAAAMALEEKSLAGEAAESWERYLEAAPRCPDRAGILYRAGKLFMEAGRYGKAAAAFVRAELAAGKDKELSRKIGPRMVECLRRLGLHGEVGRELSRRVEEGAGKVGRGRTLALLDGEPLCEADLDRMIERRVDQVLAMGDAPVDETARARLLDRFKDPAVRKQLFQELLRTALFSRRARELGMNRDEAFLAARAYLEENLLASRFLARELERVRPTEVDLESWYEAHKDTYKEPEGVKAVLVELREGENPAELLKGISSPEAFKTLAAKRAGLGPDEAPVPCEIRKGVPHSLLGEDTAPLFALEPGRWTQTALRHGKRRFLALVEEKIPERTPPLSEVKGRVEAEYRARKEQEITETLLQDLMTRYHVKILAEPGAAPAPKAPSSPAADAGKKETSREAEPDGGKKEKGS